MSWESRPRGGRYYTRSRRVNGRVVREYLGTGPRAEAAAARDRARRRLAQAHRDARRALDADLGLLDAVAILLARADLVAAGYHQHARGQWRKRRVRRNPLAESARPA